MAEEGCIHEAGQESNELQELYAACLSLLQYMSQNTRM